MERMMLTFYGYKIDPAELCATEEPVIAVYLCDKCGLQCAVRIRGCFPRAFSCNVINDENCVGSLSMHHELDPWDWDMPRYVTYLPLPGDAIVPSDTEYMMNYSGTLLRPFDETIDDWEDAAVVDEKSFELLQGYMDKYKRIALESNEELFKITSNIINDVSTDTAKELITTSMTSDGVHWNSFTVTKTNLKKVAEHLNDLIDLIDDHGNREVGDAVP